MSKEAENIVHELALIDPVCTEHNVMNAHKIVALIARARELNYTFDFCESCANVVDRGEYTCSECVEAEEANDESDRRNEYDDEQRQDDFTGRKR